DRAFGRLVEPLVGESLLELRGFHLVENLQADDPADLRVVGTKDPGHASLAMPGLLLKPLRNVCDRQLHFFLLEGRPRLFLAAEQVEQAHGLTSIARLGGGERGSMQNPTSHLTRMHKQSVSRPLYNSQPNVATPVHSSQ